MTSAWALRGGASFGAAQVGTARALMEAGHYPDLLFGSSAGALNAAWLAFDPTLAGLRLLADLWERAEKARIFALRPWVALPGLLGLKDHIMSGRPLERWLRGVTPLQRVEDGVLPLTVVATDLADGSEVLIERGPLVPALVASSAMPGAFPPVKLGGRWLIDGGIAMDTPIGPAVEAGADEVWVLESVPPMNGGRPRGALDVVLRSSAMMLARHHDIRVQAWCSRCRLYVVPAPVVPGISPFDLSHSQALAAAGYETAKHWLRSAEPVKPERVTVVGSPEVKR